MSADLSKELWYYGRVSRTDAEKVLDSKGNIGGSFLVRDSLSVTGEYILSLSHSKVCYHYIISRHLDGMVAIQDGAKFDSPMELVQYHMRHIGGLLTTLKIPCRRNPNHPPQGYRFISHEELQKTMREVALLLGYKENQVTTALSSRRSAFEQLVGGLLHRKQLWFHGAVNREESEFRMRRHGVRDGLFLVRERTQVNSFALCLCHNGMVYHYLLDMNSNGQLSIQNGRQFDNLIQVVDHYSRTPDGLLRSLGEVCPVNMFPPMESEVRHGPLRIDESEITFRGDLGAGTFGTVRAGIYRPKNGGPELECAVKALKPMDELPNQKAEILREADAMANINHANVIRLYGICASDPLRLVMEIAPLGPLHKYLRKHQYADKCNNFFIYTIDPLNCQDGCTCADKNPVEPHVYKNETNEVMRLSALTHLLYREGLTVTFNLVLGGVNVMFTDGPTEVVCIVYTTQEELKREKSTAPVKVMNMIVQISQGMEYLEQKQFVHRDLAARNVLVVTEDIVKISDFGMSRAIGANSQYYKAETAGKWPLKWYAPECIFFATFYSKSDVWSFGITTWEAFSYGAKPYQHMSGQATVEMLESNKRLDCPNRCPSQLYEIMLKCWSWRPEDRPTFAELTVMLQVVYKFMQKEQIHPSSAPVCPPRHPL